MQKDPAVATRYLKEKKDLKAKTEKVVEKIKEQIPKNRADLY